MNSTIDSEPEDILYTKEESWLTFVLWKMFEILFCIGQLILIWAVCIGVSMFLWFLG